MGKLGWFISKNINPSIPTTWKRARRDGGGRREDKGWEVGGGRGETSPSPLFCCCCHSVLLTTITDCGATWRPCSSIELCQRSQLSVWRWSPSPSSFYTSFRSDHQVVPCWPVERTMSPVWFQIQMKETRFIWLHSQHRNSTLEEKILPPFPPGLELATFRSRVRRSYQQAIPAPNITTRPLTHSQDGDGLAEHAGRSAVVVDGVCRVVCQGHSKDRGTHGLGCSDAHPAVDEARQRPEGFSDVGVLHTVLAYRLSQLSEAQGSWNWEIAYKMMLLLLVVVVIKAVVVGVAAAAE